MITRVYIDNVRTLVNFEWRPGPVALLMGDNGTGKSTIVEVIFGIRGIIVGDLRAKDVFLPEMRTAWETRTEHRVEVDVQLGDATFEYQLVVRAAEGRSGSAAILVERLKRNGMTLVSFQDGAIRVFADDGSEAGSLPAAPRRSILADYASSPAHPHIAAFVGWMTGQLWLFEPNPREMVADTDDDGDFLSTDLSNFASWFAAWVSTDPQAWARVNASIAEVLPGFQSLAVRRSEPVLEARFAKSERAAAYSIAFDDLSDGQRVLCALYAIRHAAVAPGQLLMFDEPENFLALREIQPWLLEMLDAALGPEGPQLWFISHHPEILNQLAPNFGVHMHREGGPTRVAPFAGDASLSASELIARGWDEP